MHVHDTGSKPYVDDTMVTVTDCRNSILRLFEVRFAHLDSTELLWASLLDPRVEKCLMIYLNCTCSGRIRTRNARFPLKKCSTDFDRYLVDVKLDNEKVPEFIDHDTNPFK
ncbi:Hypothetical protein PHPALM_6473 [Phytophthora palmivora]|uniref:Uncharacterized protein n=1 Tax=Phytophthora palmivora TaxID=4796 RepID=A0A2P4YF23_9STRA|nr:Hypothetical protein PHPALM_6473 [Phytophthora palmivora]